MPLEQYIKELMTSSNQLSEQLFQQTPTTGINSYPERPLSMGDWMQSKLGGTGGGELNWLEGLTEWWNDLVGTNKIVFNISSPTPNDTPIYEIPFIYLKEFFNTRKHKQETDDDGELLFYTDADTDTETTTSTNFPILLYYPLDDNDDINYSGTPVRGRSDERSGEKVYEKAIGLGSWILDNVVKPFQSWWDSTELQSMDSTAENYIATIDTDLLTGTNSFLQRIVRGANNIIDGWWNGLPNPSNINSDTPFYNIPFAYLKDWWVASIDPNNNDPSADSNSFINRIIRGVTVSATEWLSGLENWWDNLINPEDIVTDTMATDYTKPYEIPFIYLNDWWDDTESDGTDTTEFLSGNNNWVPRILRGILSSTTDWVNALVIGFGEWWNELDAMDTGFGGFMYTIKQIGEPIFEWFEDVESNTRSTLTTQYTDIDNPTLTELITGDNIWWKRAFRGITNWWDGLTSSDTGVDGFFLYHKTNRRTNI